MIIRTALPEDAQALLEIYSPYIEKTAITFEYTAPSADEFRMRIQETLKTFPYIVAEEDGVILGYAYAGVFHAREAYSHCVETSIYVREGCSKRGIGKALYTELERLLLKQSVFILYACIAEPGEEFDPHIDDNSIRFHERMGYAITGRHRLCGYKFGKWYSIVWMEKRLCNTPAVPQAFIPFRNL